MNSDSKRNICWMGILTLLVGLPFAASAQDPPSACVEMGGLAWDNWTKSDSGGSGMPDGETDNDYVRCKACHGWDHLGTDGGYARRSRKDGRPNAGAGDSDQTSRDISFATRAGAPVTSAMIFHAGTGRSFADGSEGWVPLDNEPSAANTAAHAASFTLGNQHPDFSTGGADALSQQQADCLAEFLNFPDAGWDAYFDAIIPGNDSPVLYMIRSDADADRGESLYANTCFACHGDPATDHNGLNNGVPEGGILAYTKDDGKFSEMSNKVRWGFPDEIMTRDTMGNLTALATADIMLYLQQLGGTGFSITAGISGTWIGPAGERDGEGWLIDMNQLFIAAFYTQNGMGDQAWMIGSGAPTGNQVTVNLIVAAGPAFGDMRTQAEMVEEAWGTATFTFTFCDMGFVTVTPNATMLARGFVEYTTTISPLLGQNAHSCP